MAERIYLAELSTRAEKKWNQLDVDESGRLDGDEVMALAEWVWCSFRPEERITAAVRLREATKLLNR